MAIVGLLWHKSNKETTIIEEIDVAKKHYIGRMGKMPTVAVINPNHDTEGKKVGDLLIIKKPYIGYSHILIGEMKNDERSPCSSG